MGKKSKSKKKSSAAPPVGGDKKESNEASSDILITVPPPGQRGIELRFEVGTEVLCHVSRGDWCPGRITQHWHRERHWPDDCYAPYEIELNCGTIAHAVADLNDFIKSKDPLPHMIYEEKADAASQDGDQRKAASLYLESFRLAPNAWTSCRFNAFHSYCTSLIDAAKKDSSFQVTKKDIKDMKYVLNSEQEPISVRVKAAMMLSVVHCGKMFNNYDSGTACDFLRIGLSLYNLVTSEEKQKVVLYSGKLKRIEEVLKELRELISDLMADLNGRSLDSSIMASDYPLESRLFYPGGNKCNCCGKTLEELGVDFLGCCRRCKKAHYCSVECQKKQWNAGHKEACRKPGQIKEGDVMLIRGLVAKPEFNHFLVSVVGKDAARPEQWQVKVVGEMECTGLNAKNQTLSILPDNLSHIRPLK